MPKEPETVEFYPPYNLDAAQIGYLYVKDTGKKLAISLIVELASKGYLEILNTSRKDKLKVKKTEKAVGVTSHQLLDNFTGTRTHRLACTSPSVPFL